MIAYFCDQCTKQIQADELKTPPTPGDPLVCASCTRKQQKKQGNELVCDGCQTSILPIDLRTKKAFVREDLLYCSKCIRKIEKHHKSLRYKQLMSFFLFVCFPLLTALILFGILKSSEKTNENQEQAKQNQQQKESFLGQDQGNTKTGNEFEKLEIPDTYPINTKENKASSINSKVETLSTEELIRLQEQKTTKKSKVPPRKEETSPVKPPSLKNPMSVDRLKNMTKSIRQSQDASVLKALGNPATQLLALVELKEASPVILTKIHSLLVSPDPILRSTSARILGRLQSPTSVENLIRTVSDPEVVVRNAAKTALRQITGEGYENVKDMDLPEDVYKGLLRALREKNQ